MTNKEIKINDKQTKFTNGLLLAQSFQMAKMNRGLENVFDSLLESQTIQRSILAVQDDIKNISSSQLEEAVKLNKLKKLEIEQNSLRYEQEKTEKNHIILQRNLAFELKNSVEEVEESESPVFEKFFFLNTSEELFKELDTEKFEISEMEYCRNALQNIQKSRKKYENLLSDQDIEDLETIKLIEEKDENKSILEIKNELKKYEKLSEIIDDLDKLFQKLDKSDLSQSDLNKFEKQFFHLTEKVHSLGGEFEIFKAEVSTAQSDETNDVGEQNKFEIFLIDAGERKIDVIKVVKAIADLDLTKAKVVVDDAPTSIKSGVDKDEAEQAKSQLENVGAKVELK